VFYSFDGITWTQISIRSGTNLRSIAFGDGKFVAVGYSNFNTGNIAIAFSTDGIFWQYPTNPPDTSFMSIAYGEGRFIATVVQTNKVYYSTDGTSWTEATIPQGNTYSLQQQSIAYGNGKFLIIGSGPGQYATTAVASSTDGVTWTNSSIDFLDYPYAIIYADGKFLVMGDDELAYSTDGLRWTRSNMPKSSFWEALSFGYLKRGQTIKDRLNEITKKL
jgi:hypothetical protein